MEVPMEDLAIQGRSGLSSNEDWISDEQLPDPEFKQICGWNIVVRPVRVKAVTKGGIHLPDALKNDLENLINVGKVIGMGPLAYNDENTFGPEPWCKVGDYVMLPKFAGTKFKYKGVKLLMVDERNILMLLDDPQDVDASGNL